MYSLQINTTKVCLGKMLAACWVHVPPPGSVPLPIRLPRRRFRAKLADTLWTRKYIPATPLVACCSTPARPALMLHRVSIAALAARAPRIVGECLKVGNS